MSKFAEHIAVYSRFHASLSLLEHAFTLPKDIPVHGDEEEVSKIPSVNTKSSCVKAESEGLSFFNSADGKNLM